MNNRFWASLPTEVKPIVQAVAKSYQVQTGTFNKAGYDKDIAWLRKNITVSDLGPKVRLDWAKKLARWPQAHANALEKEGFPAIKILNATLNAAEKQGYKWPL